MSTAIHTLLHQLQNLQQRPRDIAAYLASAPPVGTLPLPQFTWALLGLMHYRTRILWGWDIYQRHLLCSEQPGQPLLTSMDVFDDRFDGIVPGLPDWAYHLYGDESYLLHRGTDEILHIDVVFDAGVIWPRYFEQFYLTHKEPGPAEQRLTRLFPEGSGLFVALDELSQDGILRRLSDDMVTLCGNVTPFSPAIEEFLKEWQDADSRLWLAVAVGDWPAAHQVVQESGLADLAPLTGPPEGVTFCAT